MATGSQKKGDRRKSFSRDKAPAAAKRTTNDAEGSFRPVSLFSYTLTHLTPSQKTLFGYALRGRGNAGGLIREFKGEIIGRNSFLIPASKEKEAIAFLLHWKAKYAKKELYER